jgi:hypothetical protein
MKLAVLGGAALVCAATAVVVAQGQATAPQVQTVIGCVKGEGTTQSPWLAGVVIPRRRRAGRTCGGGRGAAADRPRRRCARGAPLERSPRRQRPPLRPRTCRASI